MAPCIRAPRMMIASIFTEAQPRLKIRAFPVGRALSHEPIHYGRLIPNPRDGHNLTLASLHHTDPAMEQLLRLWTKASHFILTASSIAGAHGKRVSSVATMSFSVGWLLSILLTERRGTSPQLKSTLIWPGHVEECITSMMCANSGT